MKSAAAGLRVWLAYGVVEFALAYGSHRHLLLLSWQWKPLLELFAVYAVCGLVLGGGTGAFLRMGERSGAPEDAATRSRIAGALTLVLAFLANLLWGWPLPWQENVAFSLTLALTVVLVAAAALRKWRQRTVFLANPWFLSLLLLASPWFLFEGWAPYGKSGRMLAALLLTSAIVAIAALWQRWSAKRIRGVAGRPRKVAVAAAAVCIAVALVQWEAARHPSAAAAAATPGRCNVVLITMDTARADHFPMYGYDRDTTPHLREFAREATVYDRAIATAGMTLPTHASIFTGLYPAWHGAYLGGPGHPIGEPLAPEQTTLAEVLQKNGYQTGAVVANWVYLHPQMGLAQGFTEYQWLRPVLIADAERPFYLSAAVADIFRGLGIDTNDFDARNPRAEDINARAFAWLDKADRNRPFFLFLNYMDAHAPYTPPAPFDTVFPGKNQHFDPWMDYQSVRRPVLYGTHHLTAAEKQDLVSQYDGALVYTDAQIARLLDRLRAMGLYDNTLILITGDHGEAFGEHDLMEHATGFLYENQVHVPLFIKYPGQHTGRESDALTSEVDLMPTVLDVAGVLSPGVQGRSLRSAERGASEPVYADDSNHLPFLQSYRRFQGRRRAIYLGPWKLLTWSKGPPELYNLESDPLETHNLYNEESSVASALVLRLNAWKASAPRSRQKTDESPMDQREVERLKSLGYLQ